MPQNLVYIHSITPGSLADKCDKFKVGDEIVMAGNDVMVGLTWKAASEKINQLVGLFKIVVQRKESEAANLEEKQQEGKKQQNEPNSLKSKDKNDIAKSGKGKPSPKVPKIKKHTKSDGVTPNAHSEQPAVHTISDESITFTVKVRVCSLYCYIFMFFSTA